MSNKSFDVRTIEWLVENTNYDEKGATEFLVEVLTSIDIHTCVFVVDRHKDVFATHVYDASDWRERGYTVYEV